MFADLKKTVILDVDVRPIMRFNLGADVYSQKSIRTNQSPVCPAEDFSLNALSGDGMPIVERTLLPVVNGMMRKPSLYLRLWGVHDVDAVVRLLGKFNGALSGAVL